MASGSGAAKARFELENDVQAASASDVEQLYRWDPEEQKAIQAQRPWARDPHHFKR